MVLFFVVLLLFLLWFPCLYHECHGNENIGGVPCLFIRASSRGRWARGLILETLTLNFDTEFERMQWFHEIREKNSELLGAIRQGKEEEESWYRGNIKRNHKSCMVLGFRVSGNVPQWCNG